MTASAWPIPIWPSSALRQSFDKIAAEPEGSLWTALSRIRLTAAHGEVAGGRALLEELYCSLDQRRVGRAELRQILPIALLLGDEAGAIALLGRIHPTPTVAVGFVLTAEAGDPAVAYLSIKGRVATLVLDRAVFTSEQGEVLLLRLADTYPILAHYMEAPLRADGSIAINLGDVGHRPGLTFSDERRDFFLIPDTCFMESAGYAEKRRHFADHPVGWEQRLPLALWRGTTTGHQADGWRKLPRVRLCRIGVEYPDLIDAGITNIVQIDDVEDAHGWLSERGMLRPHIEPEMFQFHRYQIDIDGNSNSWPGLFLKLLTGSTVLKVASPAGLRQWYYDRLIPWINHVPIDSDMSDLPDKVRWLRDNDDLARTIGVAGRELALSMTFEGEIAKTALVVEAARRGAAAKRSSLGLAFD